MSQELRVILPTVLPAILPAVLPESEVLLDLDNFLRSLESESTRHAYRRELDVAINSFGVAALHELATSHLIAYREQLLADGRGPGSHSQALASLRSFLNWAAAIRGLTLPELALRKLLKAPKVTVIRPYQILSEEELIRLLDSTERLRDKALLAVALGGGLRVSEIVFLDAMDLHTDAEGGSILHVRSGKGRKDRLVPIRQEVADAVHGYLSWLGIRSGDHVPIFRAEDRGLAARLVQGTKPTPERLTPRGLSKVLRKLCLTAGIAKPISPHSLRHTYSMRVLRATKDLMKLKTLLGHASITTTQKYADHLALGELRQGLPPLPSSV